ncbi:MAG: hypothetical protein JWQ38_3775, partial [Flavipsychrobacter sp.]|nr:hypothetical protein [Flavipsychrobacter sp.]
MQARFIRNLLIMCMSVAVSYSANAQNASRIYIEPNGWSIGTNLGTSDLFGDVGTQSAVVHYTNSKYFDHMAFMGGMFGRYTIHPAMAVKLGINYGALYATDNWNYDLALAAPNQGIDGYERYARGQNARSYIFEGSAMLEFTPLRFNPESKLAHRRGQPVLGFGVAYFHYTPYSTVGYGTRWVKSYDLSLEGQGFGGSFPEKESLWQLAIPLAFGYRWVLGQHLNIVFEYTYRMTFTVYLDVVSGKYIIKADFQNHLPA